jgi:hypothetical protein
MSESRKYEDAHSLTENEWQNHDHCEDKSPSRYIPPKGDGLAEAKEREKQVNDQRVKSEEESWGSKRKLAGRAVSPETADEAVRRIADEPYRHPLRNPGAFDMKPQLPGVQPPVNQLKPLPPPSSQRVVPGRVYFPGDKDAGTVYIGPDNRANAQEGRVMPTVLKANDSNPQTAKREISKVTPKDTVVGSKLKVITDKENWRSK